jgi:carbonic anhydrase/acetyltransferase-like protein (isoleucine patch superfamily)
MIETYGALVPTLDPTAWVHAGAHVLGDVVLHERVSVWPTTVLRGDQGRITIGADSNVQDGTISHGTGGRSTVNIGQRVTVGHRVILHGCTVDDDVLVGMGAILLDFCHVESWCIVGAGALVPGGMRIPTGSLVLGSPARVVRTLSEKDREMIRHGCAEYLRLSATYRAQG